MPHRTTERAGPLRSERLAAVLLLLAAVIGLGIANAPIGPGVLELRAAEIGPTGLRLSIEHLISDGLLAVFFFAAAVELKHELVRGELASPARALRPAIAAAVGVAVPALLYLAVAGGDAGRGWPIPTATDIAFALGVLALFGRGLPSRIRAFLLALAVIDDLIAIVLIAVLFTAHLELVPLAAAGVAVAAIAVLGRVRRRIVAPAIVLLALATWWLVHESGVHATIAGVAAGLALPSGPGMRARHALEPVVNVVVLPLFALSAAMVVIPRVSGTGPVFWAILIALPVGKVLGIGVGGWLGAALEQRRLRPRVDPLALVTVGALGGVGFTVSLLLSELAFAGNPDRRVEATLGVLAGSAVSLVVASLLVILLRSRVVTSDRPTSRERT